MSKKIKPLKMDFRGSLFGYISTKIYFLYSTTFDTLFLQKMLYLIKGDDNMKELFEKSLRMIKYGKIKSVKQYTAMLEYFEALNVESLKYITGKNFKGIVKLSQKF